MLRGLLLALLLANLVFLVWSRGSLGNADGSATGGEREPERLSRQVHPEAVQLLRSVVAASPTAASASAATAADPAASGTEAASAASSAEAASAPEAASAATEAGATAALAASAASVATAGSAVASSSTVAAIPTPPPPPGTRCLEAGPFSGTELASVETALTANAKTRRIARRWVQMPPEVASAPAAPQHRLRIDATPSEVAVLEALPVSVVGRSFAPCTAR